MKRCQYALIRSSTVSLIISTMGISLVYYLVLASRTILLKED